MNSTPRTSKEDHEKVLNNLGRHTLSLEHAEGGGNTDAESSVLRTSMLAGNADVKVERQLQSVSEVQNVGSA